ncbi:MAG TPA: hypothetical protein VMX75_09610 [Spirochaetia bacterium]|nr:hypothetical protein [Spirochaetia bacterium]
MVPIRRTECLFRTENILEAVNTLLKELGEDHKQNRILKCSRCSSGLDTETCESYHEYLKSIYQTLVSLKGALKYIE